MPSLTPRPFAPMEKALQTFLRRERPAWVVGRDLPSTVTDLYVRIERIGGPSDQLQGRFVFDVEVFSPNYSKAESTAADLEALLLGYPLVVKVGDRQVVFDRVDQNAGVSEIFWDDDNVHRLLATYVITARR